MYDKLHPMSISGVFHTSGNFKRGLLDYVTVSYHRQLSTFWRN